MVLGRYSNTLDAQERSADLFLPSQASKCIREGCPYQHASRLLEEHPGGGQDFFELIPCTFAGMSEGCKWHRNRFGSKKWVAQPFELIEEGMATPACAPPNGAEFAPKFDGQKWLLQQCGICKPCPVVTEKEKREIAGEVARLEADLKDATQRFLDGLNSDESDDDASSDESAPKFVMEKEKREVAAEVACLEGLEAAMKDAAQRCLDGLSSDKSDYGKEFAYQ